MIGTSNGTAKPMHHYSTTEQVVGTWLGKPIYERIIAKQDNLKSSNTEWVNNNVNTAGVLIDELLDFWWKCDVGICRPYQTRYNGTNIDVLYSPNQSQNFNAEYAVIRYTKTTDTAV